MNWFITTLCLIAVCKDVFSGDGCQYSEPGKYPAYNKCDHYVVCTGAKGRGVKGSDVACPAGTRFDKYQRECVAEQYVDCAWCFFDKGNVEDPTSKAHFFTCGGPYRMDYAHRFKCNKGDFNPATEMCSETKVTHVMDLETDATPDDHEDKKAFAEEARTKVPEGKLCRPCRCTACPKIVKETTAKPLDTGDVKP